MWAREPEVVAAVGTCRENTPFLPGFRLREALTVTNELERALEGADVVVVAVPSQHLRAAMTVAGPYVPCDATVVSLAKGIEPGTLLRGSQVLAELLGEV